LDAICPICHRIENEDCMHIQFGPLTERVAMWQHYQDLMYLEVYVGGEDYIHGFTFHSLTGEDQPMAEWEYEFCMSDDINPIPYLMTLHAGDAL
jgi:hypothetical protein